MPRNKLSLSLVIPVYNEEFHLKRCLESISRQSVKPNEVIVVNNNSTDKTKNIAKSYPFVTCSAEKKRGVLYARNEGFLKAKSDLVASIDGDTILPKDWVKNAKNIMADPLAGGATGPMYWYDMPFSPGNVVFEHFFKNLVFKYDKDYPFLLGANMVLRRSSWQKVHSDLCEDPDIYEDADLAIHLNKNGFKLNYSKKLAAGASARRLDARPSDFYRYIKKENTTYIKHGIKTWGGAYATFIYMFFYFVLWPIRRLYDDKTAKRSFKNLFKKHIARPDPMRPDDY